MSSKIHVSVHFPKATAAETTHFSELSHKITSLSFQYLIEALKLDWAFTNTH